MAGYGQPPTHAMKEEWRRLSTETRREALDLVFSRHRPSDEEIVRRLQEIGLSVELASWIVDDALAGLLQTQRTIFERRMDAVADRSPIDYFNRLLLSLAFLLLMLTWLAQDASKMQNGEIPISLPAATILSFFAWSAFVTCLRRWLRALRK